MSGEDDDTLKRGSGEARQTHSRMAAIDPPVIGDPYGSLTFTVGDPVLPVYNSDGSSWTVTDRISGALVATGTVASSTVTPVDLPPGLYVLAVANATATTTADFLVVGAAVTSDPFYGVQTHFAFPNPATWSAPATTLRDLRTIGLSAIRDECYWAETEQTQGVRVVPARVSDVHQRAAALGMERLFTADYGNSAVQDPSGLCDLSDPRPCERVPQTPQEQRWFADYIVAVIDQTGVHRVELWNEYNNPTFNHRCRTGACYAATMGPIADLVKQDRSTVEIVGGGIAGAELQWFQDFFEAGGLSYAFDALSYHPYTDTPTGDMRRPSTYVGRVQALRDAQMPFLAAGRSPLPLVLSEVGWSTSPASSSGNPARALDDDVQAERLVTSFVLHAGGEVQTVYWYEGVDLGNDPASTELNFGVYRTTTATVRAFQPKRSALAVWHLRSQLDGYRRVSLDLLESGVWRAVYVNGPLMKLVLFADGEFSGTATADANRTAIDLAAVLPDGRAVRRATTIYGSAVDVSGAEITVGTRPVIAVLSTPAISFASAWNHRAVSARQIPESQGFPLEASADAVSDWEVFSVTDAGRGLVALRSATNGLFVSADATTASASVTADAASLDDSARFRWITLADGTFALRSEATTLFVSATVSEPHAPLRASAAQILGWERFTWTPR